MTDLVPIDDADLLDFLLEQAGITSLPVAPIQSPGPVPLSRAQARLWFLQQLAPDSPAYHIPSAVRFNGRLDIAALEASLNAVIARHEALRSGFPLVDGKPVPAVQAECRLALALEAVTEAELPRRCADEAGQPFDLAQAPLLRARLFKLGEDEHVALLVLHHIIADGWSISVLLHELTQCYQAHVNGTAPNLAALALQYGDFARWQADWLEQEEAASQRQWWKERLAGLAPLELPTDRPRRAEPNQAGASLSFTLPPSTAAALKKLGQSEGASLFMTLLAAFAVLLHRHSGQDDIALGSPVANRNRREFEPLIGFFVNSVVLRCDLSGQPSFRQLLRRVRDCTLEALARQDFPFDEVVKALAPERTGTGNPLFQVMFSVEQAQRESLRLPGLEITPVDLESRAAKFELLLNLGETEDGLAGAFEYATELFDAQTIANMARHYTRLLEAIACDADTDIGLLPLLSDTEFRQILSDWNDTQTDYPHADSLAALFERQAAQTPDAIALEFGPVHLSYRELNARANRLARHLRDCGVAVGMPVALHLRRSADMVVGLLAIVKAGGFYVPLDTAYPRQRLRLMLDDCQAPVLLTESGLRGEWETDGILAVCVDDEAAWAGHGADDLEHHGLDGESLAYVIYTSGSTGTPKGVAVPQRAVSRLVLDSDYVRLEACDRVAQNSNVSFDAATFEIWGAWLNGASLVGVDREVSLSPPDFAAFLRRQRITTLFLTTALFNQMAREARGIFAPLRHLLFGGEQVDPYWVREVLRHGPPARLLHVYGPTENTTFSTWHLVDGLPEDAATVPIGKPIANTQAYVLDAHLQPVPVGVPGELHLAGDGLALGYLGQAELTAQRFIDNPYGPGKLYRSGDWVRWLPSGVIEFIGRRDKQVKIRGFRIELGEIEAALARDPQVLEAAVLAREDQPGRRELAAYVVAAGEELDIARLRASLAAQLPDYMVPAKYVLLSSLPLNANGKIDRARLPAPEDSERPHTPPRDAKEQALAEVWQSVLGCPHLGVDDNYFVLGGDSITAIQVVSRLKTHGFKMRVADLLRHPSIAELAPLLQMAGAEAEEDDGAACGLPLTAVQHWFFQHYTGTERRHFNQALLLRCAEAVDADALAEVLAAWACRHDALRLAFTDAAGVITQTRRVIGEKPPLACFDLTQDPDWPTSLERQADILQASLDLERGPLLQAGLFRCPDGDRLLLAIHHLAVDGVSWRVLLDELEPAYRQAAAKLPIELGPKTCSFKRWATRMQALALGGAWDAERDYWRGVEAAETAYLPLACATSRHRNAQTLSVAFSEAETRDLLTRVHAAYQTELPDLLLAALGLALRRWAGAVPVRITLEGHGREPPDDSLDLSRTVGWFTSVYPFLLRLPESDPAAQILAVKDALRAVPGKGLGYGMLRYLANSLEPGPVPQLSFNYLGQFDDGATGGWFRFCDEPCGQAVSPALPRAHALDIVGLVAQGRLMLSLHYSPAQFAADDAQTLLEDFQRQLRALAAHCLAAEAAAKPWAGRFADAEVEDAYPLSPLQEGLLFQSLLDPDTEAYFVQMSFRFRGALDRTAFRQALDTLAQRHAVLRSAFLREGLAKPVQVVLRERPPALAFDDLRGIDGPGQQAWLDGFRQRDRQHGFDLEHDTLLCVKVFQCADDDYLMVWSYHHILLDGWCLSVLQRDFLAAYMAALAGREPQLPVPVPYRRYIDWLARQDRLGALAFWRRHLDGYEQKASLPTDANGPGPRQLHEHFLDLDTDSSGRLAKLAAQAGVTLNAVVRALWGLLLSRHNDRDDIVFGTIVSGRPAELEGVEDMVGLFINALPVRMRCQPDLPFLDLARAVQESALASEAHQHLPLAEIQAQLGRELFDHMLVFENYPASAATSDGPAAAWTFSLESAYDPTHYDFDLTVAPGERISFKFTHNTAVYSDRLIRRIAAQLREAIACVLENPLKPLRDIDILPADERNALLRFNTTAADYPAQLSLADLFEQQAAWVPDAIAVRHLDACLSYRELNEQANRLAHYLRRLGVRPEEPVGLCVERGIAMILGPLAIFKAQAAFVPLDPGYPPDRLAYMLEQANVRIVLTRQGLAGRLPTGQQTVLLDADAAVIAAQPCTNPARCGGPGQLAYVIFTSGSTGQPKGVAVAQRGLTNMAFAWRAAYGLDRFELRLLQMASMSFDVFVGDLARALANGGCLIVCPQDVQVDPASLYRLLAAHQISLFESTPGLVLPLMDYVHQQGLPVDFLQLLIIGSDLLPALSFKALLERFGGQMRIVNSYGVTEATIDSCFFETANPDSLGSSLHTPIGKPLRNTRFYVLGQSLNLQPIGAVGELFIGGDGVALGYLNRPDLTAERFVTLPQLDDGRLYRTGDQVRWRDDGNLEFLGRIDSQVKIRGYRIELGEIEDRLLRMDSVEQAVVVARDIGGGKDLAAYVVAKEGWDADAARAWLRQTLPDHMVPPFFVALERLPLTPNGKLDRQALPDPLAQARRGREATPLSTATERALADIWRQVLQADVTDAQDDFFELGGHSLKAMQILSQIHKTLDVAVSLRDLFAHPRLSQLAALLDQSSRSAFVAIPDAPLQEYYELSHAQRRLWMLHQMDSTSAYNMPEAHLIHQWIEPPALEAAFAQLIGRHESLRTGFVLVDGEPRQQIHAQVPFALQAYDLREAEAPLQQAHLIADQDANQPFDLTTPPLLRVSLIHLPDRQSVFVMTMHHIIGDGWSGNVMFRELLAVYEAQRLGQPHPLKPLRIQYKDFAAWQNAQGFDRQEAYWLKQLAGMPGKLALPYDLTPQEQRDFKGGIESVELDAAATAGLRALAASRGTTLSNVLLALFKLFLFQWTRQDDICVGLSIANRNHPDIENLIGFFVNLLPIRCRLSDEMDFDDLLGQVIQHTHDAFEQQDYPFDLMVEKLNPSRSANRQPLVNVIYGFQNFADVHVEVQGEAAQAAEPAVAWEDFGFSYQTSKFDLTLFVAEKPEAIQLSFEYDSQLFLAATVREQLDTLKHFAGLLAGQDAPDEETR